MDKDLMDLILEAFRGTGLESGGWGMQLLGALLPGGAQAAATPKAQASGAAAVGKAALQVLTSGLGFAPLVRGIIGLFGGGQPATPTTLIRYALPTALRIQAANPRGTAAFDLVDYSQEGTPRVAQGPGSGEMGEQVDFFDAGTRGDARTNVAIQANALDSRWFMDHSSDIARAVREAMLNMSSLNDVVADL